jgi:hypothetical protein
LQCISLKKRGVSFIVFLDFAPHLAQIPFSTRDIHAPNNSNETYTYFWQYAGVALLLCVWAELAVLGSAKTALKFKYEI